MYSPDARFRLHGHKRVRKALHAKVVSVRVYQKRKREMELATALEELTYRRRQELQALKFEVATFPVIVRALQALREFNREKYGF